MTFQENLLELFPSYEAIETHKKVIIFTVGLMKDPRPLVDFVYKMYTKEMERTCCGYPLIDIDLFGSLYAESTVRLFDHPLHNQHINYYDHRKDDREMTPVHFPSNLYVFEHMTEMVLLHNYDTETELGTCSMIIWDPGEAVTESLWTMCSKILRRQAASHLLISGVRNEAGEELAMSEHAQSLLLYRCDLPVGFMRSILRQLLRCRDTL